MLEPVSRRQVLVLGTLNLIGLALTGCGTILYPERRGQSAGPLDWKVVALDAVGLLFFFVPGVIAFAVDFTTGTIYLPADNQLARGETNRSLISVHVPTDQLTIPRIEQIVADSSHRRVQLVPELYTTVKMERVDQFWAVHDSLAAA